MTFVRFFLSESLLLNKIIPSLLRFLVFLRLLKIVGRILLLPLLGRFR